MTEIQNSFMQGFYSHFFNRDIVYFFAGGLFISVCEYGLWGKIDLPEQLSLKLVGFLAVCYTVGSVLNNFTDDVIYPPKKRTIFTLYKPPYNYKSYLVINQDLIDNYDTKILNSLERGNFISILYKSVGSASLYGGLVMAIVAIGHFFDEKIGSYYPIFYTIIFVILGGYLLYIGNERDIEVQSHEVALIERIKSRKND